MGLRVWVGDACLFALESVFLRVDWGEAVGGGLCALAVCVRLPSCLSVGAP